MCSSPDTVGGGVSMAYTSERSFERSNAYVPSSCQRRAHLSSSPSSDGRSGRPARAVLPVSVMALMLRPFVSRMPLIIRVVAVRRGRNPPGPPYAGSVLLVGQQELLDGQAPPVSAERS